MTEEQTRDTDLAAAKAEARAEVRSRRAARPAAARIEAATAIAEAADALLGRTATHVSCYVSMPTEPGTDPLIARALRAGRAIVVPRIRGRELDWVRLDDSSAFRTGPLGIREPVGDALDDSVLRTLAVMLIPGLAVDRTGRRLGQGGGYFDRVLAGVPSPLEGGPRLVVVLFDDEIVDEVPVEPHDCRVHAALAPGGITRFDEG